MLPQQLRQLIYNKVNRDLDFDEYMVHKDRKAQPSPGLPPQDSQMTGILLFLVISSWFESLSYYSSNAGRSSLAEIYF